MSDATILSIGHHWTRTGAQCTQPTPIQGSETPSSPHLAPHAPFWGNTKAGPAFRRSHDLIEDCGPKLFSDGSAKPARLWALNCDELATDRVENNHWFGSRIRAPVSGVTAKVKLSASPFVPAYSP